VNGKRIQSEAQLAALSGDGEGVHLTANEPSLVLVLSGEPINEPVVSYGPFVMNTEAEIQQAIEDYKAGRMGRVA